MIVSLIVPLLMYSPCVENFKMFGDIIKIENTYYQVSGFTGVVQDNKLDDVLIKDGRVRVRSCGRYLEYRARPLLYHCHDCEGK